MGKKIALFVTHGAPEDFGDIQPWLAKCKEEATGANVIDMFNCQGELAQYVIDELLKSDDTQVHSWGEAGPSTRGQPDATRVEHYCSSSYWFHKLFVNTFGDKKIIPHYSNPLNPTFNHANHLWSQVMHFHWRHPLIFH